MYLAGRERRILRLIGGQGEASLEVTCWTAFSHPHRRPRFPHVRDVEQSRTRPDRHVLVDNAGVSTGMSQPPNSTIAPPRAVSRMQRRFLRVPEAGCVIRSD
jgi:hypothetical protein